MTRILPQIAFDLESAGRAQLAVYDLAGRLIRTLLKEERGMGKHTIRWNGTNNAGHSIASGSYYYELQVGDFRQTRKMTLIK